MKLIIQVTSLERGEMEEGIFFFFLISKKVIYTNGYSMHEEHRANPENTRRKTKKKQKIGTQSTN